MKNADDVYRFWFEDHGQKDWYGADPAFDAALDSAFRTTHEAVARGEAFGWRTTPKGRLAELVVLDQFSRQLHRGAGLAFAADCMALALAQEAVAQGQDQKVSAQERSFFYMPFMHSESLIIQNISVQVFAPLGEDLEKFAIRHRDVIERFGRFPKRNEALGRVSTPEEIEYINQTGSSMF